MPPCGNDPNCNFCVGVHILQIWVGILYDINHNDSNAARCGIGCQPCLDNPMFPRFTNAAGSRWLRPSYTVGDGTVLDSESGRAADGTFASVNSSRTDGSNVNFAPLRVPLSPSPTFRKAPCWEKSGRECFDSTICDCIDKPSTHADPQGGTCVGAAVGEQVPGFFPDGISYFGPNWTDFSLDCRLLAEQRALPVRPLASGLGNVAIVLMGVSGTDDVQQIDCFSNAFIPCLARPFGGVPCNTYSDPSNAYYNSDNQARAMFHTVDIAIFRPSFNKSSRFLLRDTDEASIDMKNKVLEFMGQPGNFGEANLFEKLDFDGADLPVDVANTKLHTYSRGFSGDTVGEQCGNLPIVPGVFGECRSRQTGCPVQVELAIVRASVQMSIWPHLVNLSPDPNVELLDPVVYPFMKVRIAAEVVPRAQFIGECSYVEDWWAEDHDRFGLAHWLQILNPEHPAYPGTGVFCQFPPKIADFDDFDPGTTEDVVIDTFQVSPFFSGAPEVTLDVPRPLRATEDVTIKVDVMTGEGEAVASVHVWMNNNRLTTFFDGGLTHCTPDSQTKSISKSLWNAFTNNDMNTLRVQPIRAQSNCGETWVRVKITYKGELTPSSGTAELTEDDIIYVDPEGRAFDPPSSIVWLGSLSPMNAFGFERLDLEGLSGTNYCCNLLKSLHAIQVEGQIDFPGGISEQYGGVLEFDFDTSVVLANCPE